MRKLLITICLSTILTTGCAEYAESQRRENELNVIAYQYVRDHSTDEMKELVAKGQIAIGMNIAEVHACIGLPDDINKTIGSWGRHEQWIYYGYQFSAKHAANDVYLYCQRALKLGQ